MPPILLSRPTMSEDDVEGLAVGVEPFLQQPTFVFFTLSQITEQQSDKIISGMKGCTK